MNLRVYLDNVDKIDKIVDGLFLSGDDAVYSRTRGEEIKSHGITRIITISKFSIVERRKIPGIEYFSFKAYDSLSQDLLHNGIIPEAVKLIEESLTGGHVVLVHCNAGISRSPTIVAAYLMKTNRWTRKEAIEFLAKKRSIIRPNETFLKQLDQYEKELFQKNANH